MHDYREDLRLFRRRRFALLFTARAVSVLGSAFAPVALAFGVLALPGADATTLSLVLAAQAVPQVAFMLFGGVLADRLRRDRVMMVGESLSATSYVLLGVMLVTGWAPLPGMVAAAALSGLGVAVLFPAFAGVVPEVVPAERLQTANGLLRFGVNAARIAGYALAGGAVTVVGAGPALLASAALFVVSGGLVAALRLPGAVRRRSGAGAGTLAELREGWREFASRQWLWVIVLQFSFVVAALQGANVFGPVVAEQELGGALAWSAMLVGDGVGMLVGVVVAIRLRPRRPMLVATLAVIPTGLPYVLLAVGAPLSVVVAGAVLMGVCFAVFGVLWETTMQREIPPAALSRVSSYDALGSYMFGPIGLLAAGPAAVAFGPRPMLAACGVLIAAVTLVALLSPGVRRLRAPVGGPVPESGSVPEADPAVLR